ncbi:C-type lectin domain family 10 member A-like [Mya arenaria]|uniref:C-type lectin domain family 10 member A-like n=1 Tax=Mya arenaria TaxID=6604 RepID=UPI0022DE9A25|nr:C-type lectin domain family 10 member A-like [Mya arenaria]
MLQLLMLACIIGVQSVQGKTYTLCPNGWLANEGSCYWFGRIDNPMVFTTAEEYCRQHNSHLVHVNNSAENDFLKDRMRQFKTSYFWMGLTDELTEGHWVWSDTDMAAIFLDFQPSDHAHNNQDCALFHYGYDYTWADVECSFKTIPVCEMPGLSEREVAVVG